MSAPDRVGNAVFSTLPQTGRLRATPVILVRQDQQRWLVAPYGAVSWVLNARAAGRVTLRRGHDSRDYTIRELPPGESGPVLQSYLRTAPAARPDLLAGKGAPVADFIAEAGRHPVFAVTAVSEGQR